MGNQDRGEGLILPDPFQQPLHRDARQGSSAPSGSSNASTRGWLTSARASATRCFWPPESTAGHCARLSSSPTSPSACSARACASAEARCRPRADFDVRQHPRPGQQPRLLEHHADVLRTGVFAKTDGAGADGLQAGDQAQQRALAAAAAADDRHELAGGNVQVDAAQHSLSPNDLRRARMVSGRPRDDVSDPRRNSRACSMKFAGFTGSASGVRKRRASCMCPLNVSGTPDARKASAARARARCCRRALPSKA